MISLIVESIEETCFIVGHQWSLPDGVMFTQDYDPIQIFGQYFHVPTFIFFATADAALILGSVSWIS